MTDGSVTFDDDSTCRIISQGTVQLFNLPIFKNHLYVEGLKHNLLSIFQICDNNHSVRFSNQSCEIRNDKGSVILTGRRTSENCYIVSESSSSNQTCYMVHTDETDLWHKRLGHVHYQNLYRLSKRELIRGLPKLQKLDKI
ncbi:GAG-pre-integrase domain-containing protein, partial [Mycobacterium kansasii]